MVLCKSLFFLTSPSLPLHSSAFTTRKCSLPKPQTLTFPYNFTINPCTHHLRFSSTNADFHGTRLLSEDNDGNFHENEELELQNKPSPLPGSTDSALDSGSEVKKPSKEEALAPFLKFFKAKDSVGDESEDVGEVGMRGVVDKGEGEEEVNKVGVEYYEPKPGDFVVGVVVSGNENRLDVNVGSELLGSMLTKEVLPLYDKEMDYLLCDLDKNREEFLVRGKLGVIKYESALSEGTMPGRPILDEGTVLFAEVLGRTLSGRPLLSCRRLYRRYSWHRLRQLQHMKEPIEVKITEWNKGGLITRIEGLRAFLPTKELTNTVNSFTELKANLGRRMYVEITRMDEAKNDIILSERAAWGMLYHHEGTLLDGTVKRLLPYGAEIEISGTSRSGLLHMSKISRGKFSSVSKLLAVGEKVKVLVLKPVGRKMYLSTVDLESEPGLFITNKQRVFSEAEEMANKYRKKLRPTSMGGREVDPLPPSNLPFDNESTMYANWKWFKLQKQV